MNDTHNGLNDGEHQQPKDKKKAAPNFNYKAFTGEDNSSNKNEHEPAQDPFQDLINSCKIDLSEMLAPPPIAMQIVSDGKTITLFTKGNFSIITGAAKSRKTFLVSMLMATAIRGSFQDLFSCADKGINIIFDTEQSRYKALQIGKRICRLSESVMPDNLHAYSLRTLDPAQRMKLIDQVLATTQNINFVAIDGIIDLDIDPILEAKQAQNIVLKLMQWTENYNIHITCVLHYNKTVATLLGHLGSFSHRKADAIIEVSKNKEDESISLVKALDCREKEFLPFAFSVDETAMPYILEDYVFESKTKEKKESAALKPKISPATIDQSVHADILKHVFNTSKEHGYNNLWRNIKNAVEAIAGETIGDNKAKDFLAHYTNNGSIIKVDLLKGKSAYTKAGQRAMFDDLPKE